MKRFFFMILTVLLLTLPSCSQPTAIKTDFSASFTAACDDRDYAGTVAKDGDHLTVTVSEPYTVQGMVFDYTDTQLSIRDRGHSTETEADYLPKSSVPSALRDSLLYLSQASYTGSESGCDYYAVDTPWGEALITADEGMIITVTEPHSGITFYFNDPK